MGGNRQILVVSRPSGVPGPEHFAIVDGKLPELLDGQVLIRNQYLSVEPAMRGWLSDKGNYTEQIPLGSVMRSLAVGRVKDSRSPDYRPGDVVTGWFGWQEFAAVSPGAIIRKCKEVDLPPSLALGVLGLNGVTALLGLEKVGRPHPGDTVVVSSAAGAVGSAVGQIARRMGCRTVGIAGGPEKVAICIEEFGYDAAVDYRSAGFRNALAQACPRGVNVYFDNTAGPISDEVHGLLALNSRVVVCGTASIEAWDPAPTGPRLERNILVKRASVTGFIVLDYLDEFESASQRLAEFVRDRSLVYREEIMDGMECCLTSIEDLYAGRNMGKRIIRLH